MSEKKYSIWLSKVNGMGSRSRMALCEGLQEEDAARQLYTMPESDLRMCCLRFLNEKNADKAAEAILRARRLSDPDREEERLKKEGISFVDAEDPDYPKRLRYIPDPPYSLYYKGRLPSDSRPSLAVIGARMATPYGKRTAYAYCGKLAAQGIQIVSGMAMGIDGIAGRAALDAGGISFAVLGSGVDICYPAQNRDLYDRLIKEGGLLSEYPPGTEPQGRLFPMRNRIISGLSDSVLVIEARKKSGTLITVDMALEQGRDIFALPGRVGDALSYGCNRLLFDGATAAYCPDVLLQHFYGPESSFGESKEESCRDVLPPLEAAVFSVLDASDAVSADRIRQMTEVKIGRRCSVREINMALTQLALRDLTVEVGIGHYRKC